MILDLGHDMTSRYGYLAMVMAASRPINNCIFTMLEMWEPGYTVGVSIEVCYCSNSPCGLVPVLGLMYFSQPPPFTPRQAPATGILSCKRTRIMPLWPPEQQLPWVEVDDGNNYRKLGRPDN